MKKAQIISLAFLLFISITNSLAQGIFPFIPDIPSNAESGVLIAEHAILTNNEKALQKELQKFTKLYASRLLYHVPIDGGTYKEKVKDLLNKIDLRFQNLQLENNKLTWISYSKRKINTEALNMIKNNLAISRQELYDKLKIAGVNGEKENLYLNFARNMVRLNKELDMIESNIEKSNRLQSIIKSIKNR